MAKPNYQYEKRQKELAKKQKKEEKQQRKAALKEGELSPEETGERLPDEVEPASGSVSE